MESQDQSVVVSEVYPLNPIQPFHRLTDTHTPHHHPVSLSHTHLEPGELYHLPVSTKHKLPTQAVPATRVYDLSMYTGEGDSIRPVQPWKGLVRSTRLQIAGVEPVEVKRALSVTAENQPGMVGVWVRVDKD